MNILKSIASDLFFHRDCVQCRAFDKGEKKETCSQECMHFNMTLVESRDKLPQPGQPDPLSHCKEKDVDDCWFYFTYSVNSNGEANVHVVETPGMNTVFPALPSSLLLNHSCVLKSHPGWSVWGRCFWKWVPIPWARVVDVGNLSCFRKTSLSRSSSFQTFRLTEVGLFFKNKQLIRYEHLLRHLCFHLLYFAVFFYLSCSKS